MKTVVTNEQVAHLWANKSQDHARTGNSNFYFNGPTLYSYRDSWPLAVHTDWKDADGAPIVLMNDDSYSVTTSRHKSHTMRALRGLPVRVFYTNRDGALGARNGSVTDAMECAAKRAADAIASAAKRREPAYFNGDMQRARDILADAAILAAAAGGKAPVIPAYINAASAKELREAIAAENARDKFATLQSELRGILAGIGGDALQILSALRHAETKRAELDRHALKYGFKVPANLPQCASLLRRIKRAQPAASAQAMTDRAADIRAYTDTVYRIFIRAHRPAKRVTLATGKRVTVHPDGEAAHALQFGGYDRRSGQRITAVSNAVQSIAATRAEAIAKDCGTAIERSARDALIAAIDAAAPVLQRIAAFAEQRSFRVTAETARDNLATALADARPDWGRWQWERVESSANAYRTALDNAGRAGVSGGLPDAGAHDAEIGAALARAAAIDANRALSNMLPIDGTRSESVLANIESGQFFAAQRQAQELETRCKNAEALAVTAAPVIAADLLCSVRETIVNVRTMLARIAPRIADGTRDAVAAWRRNDSGAPRPSGSVVFRLAASGEIESSLGARVSINAGRRLWDMIRAAVSAGRSQSWPHGEGPHVGSFTLRAIHADGSAIVGCHDISASEARAFAEFMGWPPFGDK